jgi:hypothetical protein
MATYYARSTGGNWSANTSWDSTSSSGAGPAGPPIAGDTAIFDSGSTGTITLTAAAACTVLNMTGHGGTLALSYNTLIVSGNVTIGGTITASGAGGIAVNAASTITGGVAFPGNLALSGTAGKTVTSSGTTWGAVTIASGAQTVTLGDDLTGTLLNISGNYGHTTFSGAHDITCDTFRFGFSQPVNLTLVSGQTMTVSTAMQLYGRPAAACQIKSSTASADTFLHYNGTAANCLMSNMMFTDVNCSPAIDNWYGGTLTRCNNAQFTVSSANATAGATYTNNGQTFTVDATISGGTTLKTTMQSSLRPEASGTLTKASGTGDSTITFSSVTIGGILNRTSADFATDATKILSGTTISGIAGTFDEAARNTDPGEEHVEDGVTYMIQGDSKEGTLVAGGGSGRPEIRGNNL